jgi:DNA transformation protein and related proteins
LAFSTRFAEEIIDQLAEVHALNSRRMFGALGLYARGAIFGMIVDETLYLKLDEADFDSLRLLGGEPLRPVSRKPYLESARYVAVPQEMVENRDEMLGWVRRAIGTA